MSEVKNIFSNAVSRVPGQDRYQQTLDQMAARVRASAAAAAEDQRIDRLTRHPRDAVEVTTTAWQYNGKPGIYLYANPSDMQWSLPRRGTVVKTTAGAVRNTWRNRYRKTYYDEGTVGITFQTGNIMPSMGYPSEVELGSTDNVEIAKVNPKVPPGLMNFYRFMELLDQPSLLGSFENRHVLVHHSRVFPNLCLEGYFLEDGFSFSESAQDGNRLQWSATFQIYRSTPPLNNAYGLAAAYQAWIESSAQAEQLGFENLARAADAAAFSAGIPDAPPHKVTTVVTLGDKQKLLVSKADVAAADKRLADLGFVGI